MGAVNAATALPSAAPDMSPARVVERLSGASWFARRLDWLTSRERGYFAVDGGAGAMLLVQLAAVDARLRPVASPRHADVLVVVEPVTPALLVAIVEAYRQMPSPRRLVVVGPNIDAAAGFPTLRLEDHLPVAERVDASLAAPSAVAMAAVAAAVVAPRRAPGAERDECAVIARLPTLEEEFITLRPAAEHEMATEDLVMNLGPIQPATSGPLQLLLTMDGEQVVRADIRSGFAHRSVEEIQVATPWSPIVPAPAIDPLAPVAVQLAWTEAIEQLCGIVPSVRAQRQRVLALQLERAASQFVWLTRFADLVGFRTLSDEARQLTMSVIAHVPAVGSVDPTGWRDGHLPDTVRDDLACAARSAHRLVSRLQRDWVFTARMRGLGAVNAARARAVGATGAVLRASESGAGDVHTRVLSRLGAAAADLTSIVSLARAGADDAATREHNIFHASPPPGTATVHVEGPRGVLTLTLESAGRDRPARVRWNGPSRAHLALVAELVVGLTIPDLLACVASLDLSMAEADG